MNNLFLTILNMSITASYIAIAVILLRLLLRRAPKFITCILWALVGLRLIFPFSFESILSLVPSAQTVPPDIVYSKSPEIQSGISSFNTIVNPIIQENFTPDKAASINPLQVITFIAANVWIIGVIAMLIYCLISYIKIRRQVLSAVKEQNNIYLCDAVSSPFILGIIKPRIYLPSSIQPDDKAFVLSHENAHIKRLDHIWKPLGFLLLSIYWFNPILWVAYILLCRDIELACDEHVIKKMGIEDKKLYSTALLSLSVTRRSIAACPVAFGEVGVKGRVKSILNYKKPGFWLALVAVITCIAVSVTFLTNPRGFKIYDINDAGDYSKIFKNVTEIDIKTGDVTFSIKNEAAIKDVVKMLKKINLGKPTSNNRSEHRSKVHSVTINGEDVICFTADFTRLWINNSVKPTFTYEVKNPEAPKKYFENINTSRTSNSGCDLEGVSLTLNNSVIIDDGGYLSITINNNTKEEITCGEPFKMFYKKNDKFIEIPLKKNYGFHMLAYLISPAENLQKSYQLECFDLPNADVYRFETTVTDKNGKNYTAWLEFSKTALGEYLGFDPDAVNGTTDGYQYFHATVTKIESVNIYVRPFENTNELKISNNLYVSTNRLKYPPELKVGDEIRILYDGEIEEGKYINSTHAIYLLKDILPQKYTDTSNLQFQYSTHPADILRITHLEYTDHLDLLKDYMANKTLTGNGSLPIFKLNSQKEIAAFATAFEKVWKLENPNSWNYTFTLDEEFNNITKKYTDEFLADNTLFVVHKHEGSGSYRHAITGLSVDGNSFNVQISKHIAGGITCDIGDWFIVFSVPNEKIANCTEFNAVRGPDAYITSEHGTLYYYKEPLDENESLHGGLSIRKTVDFQQESYQKLLSELKTAKWVNDAVVDRLSFTFDGFVDCGYYLDFSLEQKIVYCNGHFSGMSDTVYQILSSLK